MTNDATPQTRPRPTKYPARLATMLTQQQRSAIDERVRARAGATLGEVTRELLDAGFDLETAYDLAPGLRENVARLARDSGVTTREALATLLDFAVRESERRGRRYREIAARVAHGLAESGFEVDAVEAG